MLGYSALVCLALGLLLLLAHDLLPFLDSRFGNSNTKGREFIRSYGMLLTYTLFTAAIILGAASVLPNFNIRV